MDKKYNKMSITKALETARGRVTALATINRHTRDTEANAMNGLFSKDPSRV